MYHIIQGSTHELPDVAHFFKTLNTLAEHPIAEARTLFDPLGELIVTRAPGRLDMMGGIADYSGSLVLQLPIREATCVALQRQSSPMLRLISLGAEENNRKVSFEMPLADFERDGKPLDYAAARAYFEKKPAQQWTAYVAGVFLVLIRECGVTFSEGAHILISSDVPEGKGVSSSAALEVAVMQAVMTAFDITLSARDVALLCQKVENLVVGAPCGVMDQMTASCGKANRLLSLLCQPAELQDMVSIPEEIAIWGLDSGVRHSVSGADYGSVRIGAFMGYRMIAQQAGFSITHNAPDEPVEIDDPRWQGYLANLSPSDFEQHYARQLPYRMSGAHFLRRYGNTSDTITQINPTDTYAVRIPTAHPIYEHFRVRTFAELLNGTINERQLELLGELMYQSHASYSACGLGSQGTDKFVELVRAAGVKEGLYGAKITGGGSGGTVAVLGRKGADTAIEASAEDYALQTGHQPHIFKNSSLGAAAFGYLRLKGEA